MNKQDLRELFRVFDQQAREAANEAADIRKNARGILKPEVIERQVGRRQGIVLAYGMGEISFSPAELKAFLDTIGSFQFKPKKDSQNVKGVPYSALIRASRREDVQRSKEVRNATLYQRKGDIIYFQVTGNSMPFYRVQIRLEEWNAALAGTTPVLQAAKQIIKGRLSFECPCGRHQYWYRYMATLGNYAIAPLERGFPKIRNRNLRGCCCKHVLKVLHELKSNRVLLLLAKELERERNKSGFSGNPRKYVLTNENLRLAQAKRMTRDAMAAFKKYEQEAAELKKKIKPKKKSTESAPKVSKEVLKAIKVFLQMARAANMNPNTMLNQLAKAQNMKRSQLDAIIREHNL